jgi:hypothetical protein
MFTTYTFVPNIWDFTGITTPKMLLIWGCWGLVSLPFWTSLYIWVLPPKSLIKHVLLLVSWCMNFHTTLRIKIMSCFFLVLKIQHKQVITWSCHMQLKCKGSTTHLKDFFFQRTFALCPMPIVSQMFILVIMLKTLCHNQT